MIVIANCQIKYRMIPDHHLKRILEDCSRDTGIAQTDICLNFSPIILQAGRQFELVLQLFLPEALREHQQQIADSFCTAIARHLRVRQEDIWTTTILTR